MRAKQEEEERRRLEEEERKRKEELELAHRKQVLKFVQYLKDLWRQCS